MSYKVIPNELTSTQLQDKVEALRFKGRGIFRKKPFEKLSYIRPVLWPFRHIEISYSSKRSNRSSVTISAVRDFMLGNFSPSFVDTILQNDGGRKALKLVFSRERQDLLNYLVRLQTPIPSLSYREPADVYNQLFKFFHTHKTSLELRLDHAVKDMEPVFAEADSFQKKANDLREQIANFSGDKKSDQFKQLRSLLSDYTKKSKQLRKKANSTIASHERQLQVFIRKWHRGQQRFLGLKPHFDIVNFGVIDTYYYMYWVARLDSTSSTRYLIFDRNGQQVRTLQNMLLFDKVLHDELDTVLQFKKFSSDVSCFYCKNHVDLSHSTCPHCSKDILRCSVCKLPISFGDQTASCPKCGSIAHFSHLHEWIKTQGKCPTCMQDIKLRNLIVSGDDESEEMPVKA